MSRPCGSTTKRYTGRQLQEHTMNATALLLDALEQTKGNPSLSSFRKRAARCVRGFRSINHTLD